MREITRNKMVELPTNVGDSVFFIKYPTSANINDKKEPYIQKAQVFKIEYTNNNGCERFRVDFEYEDKSGVKQDWYLWEDNYLFTTEKEAMCRLSQLKTRR